MLKATRSTTFTGTSTIESGQTIATFSATLNDDNGTSNIVQSIRDNDLYLTNKSEVRKDASDFQNLVYAAQDEIQTSDDTATSETPS